MVCFKLLSQNLLRGTKEAIEMFSSDGRKRERHLNLRISFVRSRNRNILVWPIVRPQTTNCWGILTKLLFPPLDTWRNILMQFSMCISCWWSVGSRFLCSLSARQESGYVYRPTLGPKLCFLLCLALKKELVITFAHDLTSRKVFVLERNYW